MIDETAFLDLVDCLNAISSYKKVITEEKQAIEQNIATIEDFDELISLKKQAKTSIASRYAEKIEEILNEMPSDIKIVLSNSSWQGSANKANLSLDFLGKRFFLLNNAIPLSPTNKNEEQTTSTLAKNIANNMDKLVYSKDMLDVLEIYNEYQRDAEAVPEILIERELEKKQKALTYEVTGLKQSLEMCQIQIGDIACELERMKEVGFLEKLFSINYVKTGKKHLEILNNKEKELKVKLAKAEKDKEDFTLDNTTEREKITKKVATALTALERFVKISESLTELRLNHEELYTSPISALEERKSAFVKANEEHETKITEHKELIAKNENEAKATLKHIYENEELAKKLLATSTEWGTDEKTAAAIKFVKANYKKELSNKITSLLN